MFTFFTIYFEDGLWTRIKHTALSQYKIHLDSLIDREKIKNIILSQYMTKYIRQFIDDDITLIVLMNKRRIDVFADKNIFEKVKQEIEDDADGRAIVYEFPQPQFKPAMLHPSFTRYVYAMKPENLTYKDILDVLYIFGDVEIFKISEYSTNVCIDNCCSYENVIEFLVDFGDYRIAEYFEVFMSQKMFVKLCESCKLSQYGSAYMEVSEKELDLHKYGELYNQI